MVRLSVRGLKRTPSPGPCMSELIHRFIVKMDHLRYGGPRFRGAETNPGCRPRCRTSVFRNCPFDADCSAVQPR